MGWLEFLKMVFKALQVPHSEDPSAQLAWRKAVAFCLMALILVCVFSFFWAQGKIPGLSGVALADDLKTMSVNIEKRQASADKAVVSVQMILVKNGIKQSLKDLCNAMNANNQLAMDSANNDLDGFRDQYRDLTGREWIVPDCKVVLISPAPLKP